MGISDWSSDVCSSDLGRVVNWTHRSVNRRIPVPFRVGFGVDKELVKQAALEAAARVPFTLATEGAQRPQVWLVAYGENGVAFLLVAWRTGAASRRTVAIPAEYRWGRATPPREHNRPRVVRRKNGSVRVGYGLG